MKRNPSIFKKQKSDLARLGVQAIYLFGSRAQGLENALSDYDYAVLMRDSGHTHGDQVYQYLYDVLSDISPRNTDNDIIDILFLRDAGLELQFHVVKYGKILYEEDLRVRLAFEEETLRLYCDYRPLLDQFDRTLLETIAL